MGARSYEPRTGLFVSVDPHAGFQDKPFSLLGYQYAYGNPARYVDPSGEYILEEGRKPFRNLREWMHEQAASLDTGAMNPGGGFSGGALEVAGYAASIFVGSGASVVGLGELGVGALDYVAALSGAALADLAGQTDAQNQTAKWARDTLNESNASIHATLTGLTTRSGWSAMGKGTVSALEGVASGNHRAIAQTSEVAFAVGTGVGGGAAGLARGVARTGGVARAVATGQMTAGGLARMTAEAAWGGVRQVPARIGAMADDLGTFRHGAAGAFRGAVRGYAESGSLGANGGDVGALIRGAARGWAEGAVGPRGPPGVAAGGGRGGLHTMGRSVTDPVALTADEFQAVAKSVRRQVQKLNKAGVGDAGQAYQAALARGDYRAAGTIAHNRMFSRLGSRPLQTTSGSPIQINRWLEPPPGATSSFGYNYRIPDLQYGVPRTPGYRVWDFKARQPSPTFSDPTGQFADIKAWTGVDPTPLYYWW